MGQEGNDIREQTKPPCPEVMRVGELVQPLCSTWESRPCTLLGQHNIVDPAKVIFGELAPYGMRAGELALPFTSCGVG